MSQVCNYSFASPLLVHQIGLIAASVLTGECQILIVLFWQRNSRDLPFVKTKSEDYWVFFQCAPLNNWTMKWWNVIQLFNCVVYKKNRFWDLIETIILYTLMIENFFANDVVIYGTIFDLMLQSFLITRKLHLRIKWRIINSIIILEKNSPFRARLVISGEGKAIQM